MAERIPNIARYRYQSGAHEGMVFTMNRQMKGVRIEEHPTDQSLVGQAFDLNVFLKTHDIEHLVRVD